MTDHKKSSNLGIGMVIGAALGTLAGILLAPKSGKENRDAIKTSLKNLQKKFEEQGVPKTLEKLLADSTEITTLYYKDVKTRLSKELETLSQNVARIDLEAYTKKVDEALEKAKAKYPALPKKVSELRKYFLNLFETHGEDLMDDIKEEAANVKKEIKKTTTAARKTVKNAAELVKEKTT